MKNRCTCGSYAINPHMHGRDPNEDTETECDVCYWRNRHDKLKALVNDIELICCGGNMVDFKIDWILQVIHGEED